MNLISYLAEGKHDEAWNFMKDDIRFALAIANCAKDFPKLRRKIIEQLPDDGNIQKDRLLLLLCSDESNMDEAFKILQKIDLSNLKYIECQIFLKVAREKKAWDFLIIVLERLLSYEKDPQIRSRLQIELFQANLELKRLPEAIQIGKELLINRRKIESLSAGDMEQILSRTISAMMGRGDYPDALILLDTHSDIPHSFEFKLGIETDLFIKNNMVEKAVASIVNGITILKTPTPEQYAKLYFFFTQISNLTDFKITSLDKIEPGSFVKIKDRDRWYYLGDGESFDANKISSKDDRYITFLNLRVADTAIFESKYASSTEGVIENILTKEKYLYFQATRHFHQLASEGSLDGVVVVNIRQGAGTIDLKNIIAFLEDESKGRKEFFDLYCKQNIPLAFLAHCEGGLMSAIGTIQNENKGFIKFSSGQQDEISDQKEIAKKIIAGQPFYFDGSSALILSETGLLKDICSYLNFKVPQSVIAMLQKCKEKFRYIPGQKGYLKYAQGKVAISELESIQREVLQSNLKTSIKLLESNHENIKFISAASKAESWIESKIPDEMCDACVLAQKDDLPILTEDYLYLQANSLETGKKAPDYCSAYAIIKTLYDHKKLSFEKFLHFFTYLSNYRFWFLPVTVEDMERAVFGDGNVALPKPENIRLFNFPLTMSEEYGVRFSSAFSVIQSFLMKLLLDDSIVPDLMERFFLEILSAFPDEKNKKTLAMLLLNVCKDRIEKRTIISGTRIKTKIQRLFDIANILNSFNASTQFV